MTAKTRNLTQDARFVHQTKTHVASGLCNNKVLMSPLTFCSQQEIVANNLLLLQFTEGNVICTNEVSLVDNDRWQISSVP